MELALGACPVDDAGFWTPPDFWDAEHLATEIRDRPCVWTDGSREDYPTGGFEVAGAGVFFFLLLSWLCGLLSGVRRRNMVMLGWIGVVLSCRFWALSNQSSVPSSGVRFGPLQALWPGHLRIDNLNVVRSIAWLLDHGCFSKPLPLVEDGDLIAIIQHMILARGRDTVKVAKVKGHAADADVELGGVRLEDRLGNIDADAAVDLGRAQQPEEVMYVRRAVLKAWEFCYRIVLQLHRFMVAISRVSVNHDGRGGSVPGLLVWDQGSRSKKQRRVDIRVNVDLAMLPGPLGFLTGPWAQVHGGCISGADVAAWPCSVSLLCKFSAFLSSLH